MKKRARARSSYDGIRQWSGGGGADVEQGRGHGVPPKRAPHFAPPQYPNRDAGDLRTASLQPIVPRFVDQRTMEGSFQLNPNASPFIPGLLGSSAQKAPEKQGGSSSKGEPSGSTFDPSEYEENDMDELALVKMVFSMFPNVSTDFIDELIKANDFDLNLTVDMLYELNSQDMLHDDSEAINHFHDDSEATNDLLDGKGVPGADYHKTEVPESSSNMSQDPLNEGSATTSDVKSVLPKFSQINLLHNDLGLPDDDKSAGTSIAN